MALMHLFAACYVLFNSPNQGLCVSSDEWQGLPFGDPSEVVICQLIQSDWIKIDVARISRQSGAGQLSRVVFIL